ncbi:hypothetical protein [Mycobacteroides abscessus]|uniref:hypothetical protein n=1 Tax=Mycobacteroides abscessus TaxID=36809 RepID=UPI0013001019|nr:hypothetical protein [Mycobacteroides abscessus]
MNQELWGVVSRMLAVLTIGYSAMLFLSKLTVTLGGKNFELCGKLMECVALLALVFASIRVIHPFVRPDSVPQNSHLARLVQLSATDSVSTSIRTYFYCALWAAVAVAGTYLSIMQTRKTWARYSSEPSKNAPVVAFFGSLMLLPTVGYIETLIEIVIPAYKWNTAGNIIDLVLFAVAFTIIYAVGWFTRSQAKSSAAPTPAEGVGGGP